VDVNAMLESLQADLRETGGTVTISGTAAGPYPGRPQALKRCLANVLENAIKYGKSARVIVDDNSERLQVSILDEGPGLPPDQFEKVFEPFYRVEASRNRDTGGTGLGLAIAKNVVELHGGRIALARGRSVLYSLSRRSAPFCRPSHGRRGLSRSGRSQRRPVRAGGLFHL